ncbi:hypothetical protein V6N13_075850 [Hibiscus sabdariffa]
MKPRLFSSRNLSSDSFESFTGRHHHRDGDEEEQDDDEIEETPGEFRKRVATELLDKMRAIARKEKEDRDGDEEEARDSLVTKILQ